MTEIFLRKMHGFDVKVSPYGSFYAYEKGADQALYSAKSLEDLEEILKRHASNKRHFKPIEVINISSDTVGRITSKVADNGDQVYFTHKPSPKERASRTATRLIEYGWGSDPKKPCFAKATPQNLTILAKVEALEKKRKDIDDEMKKLRGTYGSLVTWEDIGGEDD